MLLIGLHGRAGVGKDTIAKMLWQERGNFMSLALADPLKRAVKIIFDLDDETTWGREAKEKKLEKWHLSPREMFQQVGKAVRELAGPDHWIKRLQQDYNVVKDTSHVVITDIRYENEAAWVRERNGTILHIYREGIEAVNPHDSENGIELKPGDFWLRNEGTLEELRHKVREFLMKVENPGV